MRENCIQNSDTNHIIGLGVGALSTYPQIAAVAGLQGLLVYALSSGIPFLLFGFLGPVIRRQMPSAFILTEWVRHRYGTIAALVISCCSLLTIFLFMVSELWSIRAAVETMTNVPGLPVLIVEGVLVSMYTSFGGFYVSFLTDSIQVVLFLILLVICIIAIGCTAKIDKALIGPSRLLKPNLLSWKLIYIFVVAIVTNDCFMSGFWLRTFAAKTSRDMMISTSLTALLIFVILAVIGVPGLLAVWNGQLDQNDPDFDDNAPNAFYILIRTLPAWISGFVLVFCVMISCCTFDSLQSAIVSTISNDFFRNRVRGVWVRLFVLCTLAPCIVCAIVATNVLNIYLIVDLLSSSVVPVLFLGLSSKFYILTGFEIVLSVIGGIITTFVFGTIYYHSASEGAALLIMEQGLYVDDWGPFGAFVAAPVGCFIGAFVGLAIRFVYLGIKYKRISALFDKPEDGAGHFVPADSNLFVLSKPWYEFIPLGGFSRKLDIIFFLQEGDSEDGMGIALSKPWYEYVNMPNVGPKIDRFIFKPQEVFPPKPWYERFHMGKFGKKIDYVFGGSSSRERSDSESSKDSKHTFKDDSGIENDDKVDVNAIVSETRDDSPDDSFVELE